jgi:hypothetical protein
MRLLGLAIGALGVLASAIRFAVPDLSLSLLRAAMTPAGLYAIATLRIALGLVFVLAAATSRAPRTIRVLGPRNRYAIDDQLRPDSSPAGHPERANEEELSRPLFTRLLCADR